MWQDPIVQDVRRAGEELAKQANYDLHIFFKICGIMKRKKALR